MTAEERELAAALEQIRQMEENEKLQKVQASGFSEYLKKGPFVYELFSVLIHSGSAMGGHYFAYIKSFEDGNWYNFNDSEVKLISHSQVNEELQKMFGTKNDSSSAYLLQYRLYDENINISQEIEGRKVSKLNLEIGDDLIPNYLKEEIDKETD